MNKKPTISVDVKDNASLMANVANLYIKDGDVIADVTYGRGSFWNDIDTKRIKLIKSDIRPVKGIDFTADLRNLGFKNNSLDGLVLDPPYIHNPGNHQTDSRYGNAATTKGMYHRDIIELYRDGMVEAKRVLKVGGLLFVKCKDEVSGGLQCYSLIELYDIANELLFYPQDLFILVPTSRTTFNRWQRQIHARKVHSYLWVFRSVEKMIRNREDRSEPARPRRIQK